MCHPFGKLRASTEAQPKDLANEKEILRFAQNDSFAVTLGTSKGAGPSTGYYGQRSEIQVERFLVEAAERYARRIVGAVSGL